MHVLLRHFRPRGGRNMLHWFGVWWPDEERAKKAWEESMTVAHSSHVWRIKEPPEGPNVRWVVIGMADDSGRTALEECLYLCDEIGGHSEWEPPEGFLQALALRRARMISERAREGDFGLKVIRNRPRRMDRAGGMHDEP